MKLTLLVRIVLQITSIFYEEEREAVHQASLFSMLRQFIIMFHHSSSVSFLLHLLLCIWRLHWLFQPFSQLIHGNTSIAASPYVHRISGNTVITEGDSATLTCNYNAYPEPHVRWYRGNDSSYITNSSNYQVYDNFLQLINMRINMQTLYRCVVTNQWGTGNISTIVTMKRKRYSYYSLLL